MKIRFLLFLICSTGSLVRSQMLPLPPRPANSPAGTAFIASITSLARDERENVIFAQITAGNVPEFLRQLVAVRDSAVVGGTMRRVIYFVTPEYLAVGTNEDYFLTPMTPLLGQRLANALQCGMPTKRMVDRIYFSAAVKLRPQPIDPSAAMITVPVFAQHNDSVRLQRASTLPQFPLGSLVGGHKKDVIISNYIYNYLKPSVLKPVVIYGWHKLNGEPIQPVYNGHEETYVDYSHGIRLVKDSVLVDGLPMRIAGILADVALAPLLSDEGVIANPRYSMSSLAPTPPRSFGVLWDSPTTVRIVLNPLPGTSYTAFVGKDGLAFPDSVDLTASGFLVRNVSPDSLFFFRLRARDTNGASPFSEVLAALPSSTPPHALIVNGFDRASAGNTLNFIRQHADAFFANNISFSSATNDAVIQGLVSLSSFGVADYILGDESTADETFSLTEQETVKTFLRNGGSLFVSGSEIAWDLDYRGSSTDKSFINQYLKAQYVADAPNGQAGVYYAAEPVPGQIFDGLASIMFDNGTHGTIDVRYPDVINGVNGGMNCYQYSGLTSNYCAVSYAGIFPGGLRPGKVVTFGVPIETVYPAEARRNLLARVLTYFTAPTGVHLSEQAPVPLSRVLHNYPNPFNPVTKIQFTIDNPRLTHGAQNGGQGQLTIVKVYDVLGREVTTLVNEMKEPGTYTVEFDARLHTGHAGGVYFCRLTAGPRAECHKMMLMK